MKKEVKGEFIMIRVPLEFKKLFFNKCDENKISPSDLIRKFMHEFLKEEK